MDKTRSAFGIREISREERRLSFVSPMVRWFELIAIIILCLNWKAFVVYEVIKFSILVSHVIHDCIILM